jgi:hypothetical protein
MSKDGVVVLSHVGKGAQQGSFKQSSFQYRTLL